MFNIEYYITENEVKRISLINDIEPDYDKVLGQIKITCNNNSLGFICKEVPVESEILVLWFELLIKVVKKILYYDNISLGVPECADLWLGFEKCNNYIIIKFFDSVSDLKSFGTTIEYITTKNIEVEKNRWEEKVDLAEFIQEILEKTEMFIQEVIKINQKMLNSIRIRTLIEEKNNLLGLIKS